MTARSGLTLRRCSGNREHHRECGRQGASTPLTSAWNTQILRHGTAQRDWAAPKERAAGLRLSTRKPHNLRLAGA